MSLNKMSYQRDGKVPGAENPNLINPVSDLNNTGIKSKKNPLFSKSSLT